MPRGGNFADAYSSSNLSTAINASVGICTVPKLRIFFLPSFCFSSSFFFPGDIAAVALSQYVLAKRLDGFTSDDLAADGGLDGHLEELAGMLSRSFSHSRRARGRPSPGGR